MEDRESTPKELDSAATELNDSFSHISAAASRLYNDLLIKKEREHREEMRSCRRRRERKWDNILSPNAYSSSSNTRQIPPAKDRFKHSGTLEEPTAIPAGRHVKSGSLHMRNSSRDTDLPMNGLRDYLYLIRLHEYLYWIRLRDYFYLTRLHEEYSEERRQLFRRTVMKADQSPKEPNYLPLDSTVKPPSRTMDEMAYHLKPQEPTGVNKYRVKRYTQRNQNLSKNIESEVRSRADKDLWRIQIKHMEDQNGLRRRERRNEGVLAENGDLSSPNATNTLPAKDSFQYVTIEEPTAVLVRRQVKSDALPTRDFSRDWSHQLSDEKPHQARFREAYPEDQVKFNEGQFFRRTVMNRDEGIKNSNNHRIHSTVRTPLHTLDTMPYYLTPRDSTEIVNSYRVRKDTGSERDSSKNVGSGVIPRMSESPEGKQNSLRRRKTIRRENILNDNDYPSASKVRPIPITSDGGQYCVTFVESNAVIEAHQMRIRSSSMQDSSTIGDYSFRPSVREEHPEEQEINFGGDQCHQYLHREGENILNSNVRPAVKNDLPIRVSKFQEAPAIIDESQLSYTMHVQDSNRGAEFEESSDELGVESNGSWRKKYRSRLTRRIENIWPYPCNIEDAIGFVIFCVLLLTILY